MSLEKESRLSLEKENRLSLEKENRLCSIQYSVSVGDGFPNSIQGNLLDSIIRVVSLGPRAEWIRLGG